jgi:hypothetical protein
MKTYTKLNDRLLIALVVAVLLACCFAGCSPGGTKTQKPYRGCYTGEYKLNAIIFKY